jgi:hypothetical protein
LREFQAFGEGREGPELGWTGIINWYGGWYLRVVVIGQTRGRQIYRMSCELTKTKHIEKAEYFS